jgi:hypothetical protein
VCNVCVYVCVDVFVCVCGQRKPMYIYTSCLSGPQLPASDPRAADGTWESRRQADSCAILLMSPSGGSFGASRASRRVRRPPPASLRIPGRLEGSGPRGQPRIISCAPTQAAASRITVRGRSVRLYAVWRRRQPATFGGVGRQQHTQQQRREEDLAPVLHAPQATSRGGRRRQT